MKNISEDLFLSLNEPYFGLTFLDVSACKQPHDITTNHFHQKFWQECQRQWGRKAIFFKFFQILSCLDSKTKHWTSSDPKLKVGFQKVRSSEGGSPWMRSQERTCWYLLVMRLTAGLGSEVGTGLDPSWRPTPRIPSSRWFMGARRLGSLSPEKSWLAYKGVPCAS